MHKDFLPVTSDSLEATIISTQGDIETNNGLAGLDEIKIFLGNTCFLRCSSVKKFDLLEETGLTVFVEFRAK